MTSLYVICDLGLPNQKFWVRQGIEDRLKKNLKTFFRRTLAPVSLVLGLGLERFCPRKGCPWPRIFFVSLALASSLVSSTPLLVQI